MKIIDTHIHIWDFSKARYEWLENDNSILRKNYSIQDLEEERLEANVCSGVFVQAANNFEDTDWMLEVAKNTNWIDGVVGWLPLMDPDLTQKMLLEKYHINPYFKGVRHLIHDEADPKWLLQPQVIESLKILSRHGLTYDIVGILQEHIRTALKVAEIVPELKMVFDHLNQPPMNAKPGFGEWGDLMKEASGNVNFFTKISGLGSASGKPYQWGEVDITPAVEFTLSNFGVKRCFCGGDWPVSLLAGSYRETWNTYLNVFKGILSEDEQEKVLFQNAAKFYNLNY
ncbi:amidohydrolase family protein [Anditalea andensis]|uniref:Amidohydrolase n=1 Tax=Anditalea andensis TaxID=1048983 RepID=A0A074LKD7_9BACT|nr:amidohydrolase family protein [Anditalea andensis]KEO74287.1 amidohydrolase [Anditalea andensis]